MPDTSKIDLIIFDTDGTIIPSLPTVYEGIKRAFTAFGWELEHTPEEINQFIGTASGEMYKFITPPEHSHRWEELRDRARQEYTAVFRESAKTFPGVKDTLVTLRKRGYHLVLYSNASPFYFNTVIDSLDIRDCFDYAECVHENDLTKPALVRKIKEMFGSCPAAVVGDRDNDIEAARETGSLSVGVLFGYGGREPEEADCTISQFDDLLQIFDRRLPIFRRIENEIIRRKKADRPCVVGITGIDAAGKTRFAEDFEQYLISRNHETRLIHLDDFHNPEAIRYSGENPAENYYNLSFNLDEIINKLLIPLRRDESYTVKLPVLNLETDEYDSEKEYRFDRETIVIFEGVFLFRKELKPYIDYSVFLDISYEESLERGKARGGIVERYNTKYHAAQRKYLEKYPPEDHADLIVDNSKWEHPSTGK
jgi:phosphoglycolate phosphatase-like HAD superfamily hydrolase/uridine kinase